MAHLDAGRVARAWSRRSCSRSRGSPPDDVDTTWLGLKINEEHKEELAQRLYDVINEFKERGPDADGQPYSLFTALHPDHNPPAAPR